jgi:GNAT superfamily N-acetyltransferase
MAEDEFARWLPRARDRYAEDIARSGGQSDAEEAQCLWIYDIRIDDARRGRGYGKAAMLFAEGEARRRGYNRVGLNVFGGNAIARNLYLSIGYEENAIFMSKPV